MVCVLRLININVKQINQLRQKFPIGKHKYIFLALKCMLCKMP